VPFLGLDDEPGDEGHACVEKYESGVFCCSAGGDGGKAIFIGLGAGKNCFTGGEEGVEVGCSLGEGHAEGVGVGAGDVELSISGTNTNARLTGGSGGGM
jgi:hypothetical protein